MSLSFFRIVVMLVLLGVMIFVLHVPILKFISSAPRNVDLENYKSVEKGMISDTDDSNIDIQIVQEGLLYNVWFDSEAQELLIHGKRVGIEGRLLYRYNGSGEFISYEYLYDEGFHNIVNSDNYIELESVPRKAYRSDYEFKNSGGIFKLDHFEFKKFTWPYFYYFYPVIRMDWEGVGYVSMDFYGDILRFTVPLTLNSAFMYLDANYDGQLYYTEIPNATKKMAILTVSESSHSRSSNGEETHRLGYGVYLVTLLE